MTIVTLMNASRAIFIVLFIGFLISGALVRKRVMILHSYYTDFSWVNDINKGLDDTFNNHPFAIRHFYMDTKRHPFKAHKERMGQQAREMIDRWRPDLVIAADDNAQEFVTTKYANRDDIDFVFCGVNSLNGVGYGFPTISNVTGIYENIPYDAIQEQLKILLPQQDKKIRIVHVSDESPTSQSTHDRIETVKWDREYEYHGSHQLSSYSAWKTAIQKYQSTVDVILITHYHTIHEDDDPTKIVPPAEVMQWTLENTPDNPLLLGTFPFFVEHGGPLTIGISAYEQGEMAAKLAIARLTTGKLEEALINEMYVVLLREEELRKRIGGEIPLSFRSFAHAIRGLYE